MPPSTESRRCCGGCWTASSGSFRGPSRCATGCTPQPELAHREELTAASVAAELPVACQAVAGTGRLARVEPTGGPGAGAGRAGP